MNIIICGAGKVGFSISKQLSTQGHSVTVIDQSSEDIKKHFLFFNINNGEKLGNQCNNHTISSFLIKYWKTEFSTPPGAAISLRKTGAQFYTGSDRSRVAAQRQGGWKSYYCLDEIYSKVTDAERSDMVYKASTTGLASQLTFVAVDYMINCKSLADYDTKWFNSIQKNDDFSNKDQLCLHIGEVGFAKLKSIASNWDGRLNFWLKTLLECHKDHKKYDLSNDHFDADSINEDQVSHTSNFGVNCNQNYSMIMDTDDLNINSDYFNMKNDDSSFFQ